MHLDYNKPCSYLDVFFPYWRDVIGRPDHSIFMDKNHPCNLLNPVHSLRIGSHAYTWHLFTKTHFGKCFICSIAYKLPKMIWWHCPGLWSVPQSVQAVGFLRLYDLCVQINKTFKLSCRSFIYFAELIFCCCVFFLSYVPDFPPHLSH